MNQETVIYIVTYNGEIKEVFTTYFGAEEYINLHIELDVLSYAKGQLILFNEDENMGVKEFRNKLEQEYQIVRKEAYEDLADLRAMLLRTVRSIICEE